MADINVRLIYGHLTDGVTVTASTEATGFPAESAVDLNRNTQWKSDTGATHTLTVDLASSQAVTGLGLANHNLGTLDQGGYTVELRYSNDNFSGDDNLEKTLSLSDDDDYYATFSQTERYWQLKVYGGSGSAAEVGVFYLGTAQTLANNPDTGGTFKDEPVSQTLTSQALSGAATVKKVGRITRAISMGFTGREASEWTTMETIHSTQDGPYKPLFYVPRDDSAAPTEGDAYMIRFVDHRLAHQEVAVDVHSFTVNLREEQ